MKHEELMREGTARRAAEAAAAALDAARSGQLQAQAQLEQLEGLHRGLLAEREQLQLQHGEEREAERRDCADMFAAAASEAAELLRPSWRPRC